MPPTIQQTLHHCKFDASPGAPNLPKNPLQGAPPKPHREQIPFHSPASSYYTTSRQCKQRSAAAWRVLMAYSPLPLLA
ncbi:hypothetical protein ACLB2K_046729 [Fragaria x ananassa]